MVSIIQSELCAFTSLNLYDDRLGYKLHYRKLERLPESFFVSQGVKNTHKYKHYESFHEPSHTFGGPVCSKFQCFVDKISSFQEDNVNLYVYRIMKFIQFTHISYVCLWIINNEYIKFSVCFENK